MSVSVCYRRGYTPMGKGGEQAWAENRWILRGPSTVVTTEEEGLVSAPAVTES